MELYIQSSGLDGSEVETERMRVNEEMQAALKREGEYSLRLEHGKAALDANAHIESRRLDFTQFESLNDYCTRSGPLMQSAKHDFEYSIWDASAKDGVDISATQGDCHLSRSGNKLYTYDRQTLVVAIRRAGATLTDAQLNYLDGLPGGEFMIFRW